MEASVKNADLDFGVPYFHNGEPHQFIPDFIICFKEREDFHLVLETKGFDKWEDIKEAVANRWCAAVNAHAGFGNLGFKKVHEPGKALSLLLAPQHPPPS